MKNKSILLVLLIAISFIILPFAIAEEVDPVKASIQYSPASISGPQDIEVNITITNVGTEDMTEPVTLYSPDGKIIKDFGENGQILLAVGSSKTYTGKWTLTQKDLTNGEIKYYIKYNILNDDGSTKSITKLLPAKFEYTEAEAENELSITRDINPTLAKKNQEINVTYTFVNNTDKAIRNIKVTEDKSLAKKAQTLGSVEPGETKKIVFSKVMGKKNLKSSGKVTYKQGNTLKKKNFDAQTITYGESNLVVKLSADDKGVIVGDEVKLTLTIENKGNVDYYNLSVTDPKLGEVFSGETSAAGSKLKLEKSVTMQENQDFEFSITASDATGEKFEAKSNKITVKTILESQQLSLSVQTVSDKEVFYDDGGRIKFTISVKNNSLGEAKNVEIWQRDVKVYTFSQIAPGQTKTVSRDFTLSQSGKYMFEARAKNAIGEDMVFKGNEIYVEVIAPTAPPVVITPSPIPPLITMAPKTWNDAPDAFEKTGKTFNTLSIIFGAVSGIFVLMLLVSYIRRIAIIQKAKSAKASIPEVTSYRDYFSESDDNTTEQDEENNAKSVLSENESIDNLQIDDSTAPFADSSILNKSADEGIDVETKKQHRRRSPGDEI
ncbi:MAG: hypothetical protein SPI49_01505 [Eubacteriales bacterium]|nr:hypothetical protein [Eubacteriales bacterium]